MAYSVTEPRRWQAGADTRRNALGILFLFLTAGVLLFRLVVTPNLMNMVMPYIEKGGPFFTKFHLGTYAIAATLLAALFSRPFVLAGEDIGLFRSLLRHAAMLGALAGYLILAGRSGATGFLVDTYLVAVLSALLVLAQGRQSRRILATILLLALIASAAIAICEVLLQRRLMPFVDTEPFFRATGLSSHPLALGAHCAVAIGFVFLTGWRIWIRAGAALVLFIGCAAAGARTALLLSALEILLLLLFVRWPRLSPRHERQAKAFVLLFTGVAGAVLVAILLAGGFLGRFGNSIVDQSSMARVKIYEIFGHVSWKDILTGIEPSALQALVEEKLGLPFIESAPVIIVMTMGLPAAILFMLVAIRYVLRILRGAPAVAGIAVAMFTLCDLSNNAHATKTANIVLLTVLVLGLRNPAPSAASGGGVTPHSRRPPAGRRD